MHGRRRSPLGMESAANSIVNAGRDRDETSGPLVPLFHGQNSSPNSVSKGGRTGVWPVPPVCYAGSMSFHPDERRQYRKGLFNTREFWLGALVVLLGLTIGVSTFQMVRGWFS